MIYPYKYVYGGKETVLLWKTSENNGDVFVTDPYTNELMYGDSLDEIKKLALDNLGSIDWSEIGEIDFDTFWDVVNSLESGTSFTKEKCSILLEGWNFMEDLDKTFGCTLKALKTPILNEMYEKLYYGNNLPSVTPKGKTYNPIWKYEEIKDFKKEMKLAWDLFITSGYIRVG
ncbi:MAG: hypothetical protein GY862_09275 [Gammaproteobacteria bacterium]|nr:hypothetical protein [Gammaproteobacteria bacterium]